MKKTKHHTDTTQDEPLEARLQRASRCTATAKLTGKRCGMAAIRGGRVCVLHGGSAPHVKAAATMRIAMLVDPALEVMYDALNPKHPITARISAAKDILDRAGHKPIERMENINWNGDPGSLSEEQLDALMGYLEKLVPPERLAEAKRRAQIESGQVIDVTPEPVESKEDNEW